MLGKKPIFNSKERSILQAQFRAGGFLTTRQVAKAANVSYPTARNYLKKFERKNLVIKKIQKAPVKPRPKMLIKKPNPFVGRKPPVGRSPTVRWKLNYKKIFGS